MVAAGVIDIAVNPNNQAQRYILWSNGRVDPVGGVPPTSFSPAWYDRTDQPVGVAIWITNWTTGQGYVFDYQGGFQPLNGAPAITTVGDPTTNSNGLPYMDRRTYVDWSWDPAQTGQGYALTAYGEILPFGGATAPPRTGKRWSSPVARRLEMQWTPSKKALTLDYSGGLHNDFGATSVSSGPYWPGQDVARDFKVTDWTNMRGYVLDRFGAAQPFGGAASSKFGGPYFPGSDVARTLWVLSAANPLKFWQVHALGQQYEYVSSGPPTVTAGGVVGSPASTVTTTTRPTLAWDYSDPDKDLQARYQVYLFTQAYVNAHSGVATNPAAYASSAVFWADGTDPNARGVVPNVDLDNVAYRFYVRVQDTAGQWSAWATRGWTQNVPVPPAPTGLTATADNANYRVNLSVSTASSVATSVRFEFSDDGGTTWAAVRGAEAVDRAASTSAADLDIPHQTLRTYRAIAFADEPRTASLPSATASAQTTGVARYVLTSTVDSSLGGAVNVQEPVEWSRTQVAGVFQGTGATYPTVVTDGTPKARRTTLHLICTTKAEWDTVAALVLAGGTLVLRDPFGDVMYCRVVGDWTRSFKKAGGSYGGGVAHMHTTDLPLIEVAQPTPVS